MASSPDCGHRGVADNPHGGIVALREELERSGAWLFRWRGYLPLILFVPVLAGLSDATALSAGARDDVVWEVFCLVIGLVGLAIRISTVGRAPGGTSGRC